MNAIVDSRISEEEAYALQNIGYSIIKCPPSPSLYESISSHPDIQIHIVSSSKIIVQKDADKDFINKLNNLGVKVIRSSSSLTDKYPGDIILNAFTNNSYLVHNFKFTDRSILENSASSKDFINVKQGYTKCSIIPIGEKAIVTNDPSIAEALKLYGFDILRLPFGDIELPGLNYGFIGGCAGITPNNEILFFGNLKKYKYGSEVLSFLVKYDLRPIYLSNGNLVDRGSIFII